MSNELRAFMQWVRELAANEEQRPLIDCPVCGMGLQRNPQGLLSCPMGHWSDPNIKARRPHKGSQEEVPVGYTPGTGQPGVIMQHGDEYHEGRIVDKGTDLPVAGEDGELFYKEDSDELYVYQE